MSTDWLSNDAMSLVDDAMKEVSPSEINTKTGSLNWDDGDTLYSDKGQGYRLAGFNAYEVDHFTKDGEYIPGQVGGSLQAEKFSSLAKEFGYDNLKTTDEEAKGHLDISTRYMADLQDDSGNSFSTALYANGLVDPSKYTSDEDFEAYQQGQFNRAMGRATAEQNGEIYQPNQWEKAKADIDKVRASGVMRDQFGNVMTKKTATNEAELAALKSMYGNENPYLLDEVLYRHEGRTLDNQSYGAFGTSWEAGWKNIKQSAYGGMQIIGDITNNDDWYNEGTIGASRLDLEMQNMPSYVSTIGEVEFGENFTEYLKGMTGMALPYMLGIAGSAVAGSFLVAGTGGAALGVIAPAFIYAGEVYGNMEGTKDQKNASTALAAGIAMATIDRLALKGLITPSQAMKKDGFEQLKILSKKRWLEANPKPAGEDLVRWERLAERMASKEIKRAQMSIGKGIVRSVSNGAEMNLNKMLLTKEIFKSGFKGAMTEGATEMAQEGLGYSASVAGSNKEWDQEQFKDIMQNAAAGGFILGGGISTVTNTATGIGSFQKIKSDHSIAKTSGKENYWEKIDNGDNSKGSGLDQHYETTVEAGEGLGLGDTSDWHTDDNEAVQTGEGEAKKGRKADKIKQKGIIQTMKELPARMFTKFGGQMQRKIINNPDVPEEGRRRLATLVNLFARGNEMNFEGTDFETQKMIIKEGLKLEAADMKTHLINFFGKSSRKSDVQSSVDSFEEYVLARRTIDSVNKDSSSVSDVERAKAIEVMRKYSQEDHKVLMAINNRIKNVGDQLRNILNENIDGEKVGYIDDWFFKSTKINSTEVMKSKGEFVSILQEDHKFTLEEAEKLYDDLTVEGKHEANADGLRSAKDKGAMHKRRAKLSDNPRMRKFLHTNHFDKLDANIDDLVTHALDTKYLGEGDSKVDAAIMATKEALGDHWDPRIAAWIKDTIDSNRGQYKRIRNKALKASMDNISFVNTLTQLDTSMLASLPELALVIATAHKQGGLIPVIQKSFKGVVTHYKESAQKTGRKLKNTSSKPSLEDVIPSDAEVNLNRRTYYIGGYGSTAHGVLGAVDIDAKNKKTMDTKGVILDAFFRLNGLKLLTDGTRVARLAIANDAIFNDLEIISGFWNDNGANTNFSNDAYERIREIGLDPVATSIQVKRAIELAKDSNVNFKDADGLHQFIFEESRKPGSEIEGLFDNIESARISFVDAALARPTNQDRPLWYANPWVRLLTQYQGFLSTFTAHILPRLWKQARKSDPTIRYQAFAMAATMLALAMLGQELKDEWKYGEHSPYLDTPLKNAQRTLEASGLLGTGSRILGFVHPLYGNDSKNYGESSLDQAGRFLGHVKDEFGGPTFGTIKNLKRIASNIFEGDGERAAYYAKQNVPLIGRAHAFRGDAPKY